jgi:hypothetical protein
VTLVGAQYELGLCDVAGERYNAWQTVAPITGRGVFISGPSTLTALRRFSGWMPTPRGWCPAIRSAEFPAAAMSR